MRVADEAFALGGTTPGDSYLRIDKVLQALADSGADAVHPGYGFLSENAEFAQAVIDAGATWIGPSPGRHRRARRQDDRPAHRAEDRRARSLPGTADPVTGVDEVLAFVAEHGLPVAIKAAFGGGGRGLKIARTEEEIPELYESAVREAVAAFGRGECFVERYLDKPRHVETQVLADTHGNVVVVSHPRLLAAAPLPEGRRGGARAVPDRGADRAAVRRVQGHHPRGGVRRRRHLRVPRRRRTASSASSRSTPACRSSTR